MIRELFWIQNQFISSLCSWPRKHGAERASFIIAIWFLKVSVGTSNCRTQIYTPKTEICIIREWSTIFFYERNVRKVWNYLQISFTYAWPRLRDMKALNDDKYGYCNWIGGGESTGLLTKVNLLNRPVPSISASAYWRGQSAEQMRVSFFLLTCNNYMEYKNQVCMRARPPSSHERRETRCDGLWTWCADDMSSKDWRSATASG